MGKRYGKALHIALPYILGFSVIMFSVSIMLDRTAKGVLLPPHLARLVGWIVQIAHGFGIYYQKAGDTITSGLGILMTIVSMFITMNKGIIDNSANLVYGIPRNDLPVIERRLRFIILRRLNYFMPGIMLVLLMKDCYACAYTVLVYSYGCLIVNHCLYRCIFDKEMNQKAIVEQLEKIYLKRQKKKKKKNWWKEKRKENWNQKQQLYSDTLMIEDIAIYLGEQRAWENMRHLLNILLQDNQILFDGKVFIFHSMMKNAFLGNALENRTIYFQMLRCFLNREAAFAGESSMISLACFELMFEKAEELELLENAEWQLDYVMRSRETKRYWESTLNDLYLNKQNGLFLVFLERRISRIPLQEDNWGGVLEKMLKTGEGTFLEEYRTVKEYQTVGVSDEEAAGFLLENAEILRDDYIHRTKRSVLYGLLRP